MPEAFSSSSVQRLEELIERISGEGSKLRLERRAAEAVPPPYRELLVHDRDMTSTLQGFHGDTIHLEVLRCEEEKGRYFREVLLRLDRSGRVVEYGAIQIFLHAFPEDACAAIRAAKLPLGRLLHDYNVQYVSRPKFFFQVEPSSKIAELFDLDQERTVYGRRNTLSAKTGECLAEILEILPPI